MYTIYLIWFSFWFNLVEKTSAKDDACDEIIVQLRITKTD